MYIRWYVWGLIFSCLMGCDDENQAPRILPLAEQSWQVNRAQPRLICRDTPT